MKHKLYYETNEQNWELEEKLKIKGYVKTADCFWAQIFEKGNKTIILERA